MNKRHINLSTMVLVALSLLITACGQSTAPGENPVMEMYPRNRDGYADLVVGSRTFNGVQTEEGRAYVYQGSPSGLGTAAAWTAEVTRMVPISANR